MKNVSPHLLLIKPRPYRTEADCEAAALRLLRSWKRARERQAILTRRNDAQGIEVTQPKPKRSHGAAVA